MSKDVSMFNTKYRQIHRQLTGIGTKVKSALETRTSQQYFWWFVGITFRAQWKTGVQHSGIKIITLQPTKCG